MLNRNKGVQHGKLVHCEAVKHYQVSRPTLTKALKSGKVSGAQDGHGKWSIDPSELARVYQPRMNTSDAPKQVLNGQPSGKLTAQNTPDPAELEALRAQLAEVELARRKLKPAPMQPNCWRRNALRGSRIFTVLPPPNSLKKRRWWQRSSGDCDDLR